MIVAQFAELSKFGLLLGVKSRRNLDNDADMQVAVAVALDVFHPLASQSKNGSGLGAGWDIEPRPAAEGGHINFGAERGLREADRYLALKVIAIALEKLVLLHVQENIQVSRFPTVDSGLAVAGGAESGASIDPGRDANGDFSRFVASTFAVAIGAWLVDGRSAPVAAGAGLSHAEKALRLDDLSTSVAGAAGGSSTAVGCPTAVALVTHVELVEADFLFATVHGLRKAQLQVVAQVGSTSRT